MPEVNLVYSWEQELLYPGSKRSVLCSDEYGLLYPCLENLANEGSTNLITKEQMDNDTVFVQKLLLIFNTSLYNLFSKHN